MPNPLVSIIVPIYKVEPYLRRCIDSIISQTYTNLEIILVDDGSPDNCPRICDEYAIKDKRISVIHKENGGLSDARNVGLDICTGEYISFVDSDDWVANVYIESLLKTITSNNAEIAIGNFFKTNQTFNLCISNYNENNVEILSPIQAVKKLWSNDVLSFITVCGALYSKELFKKIRFPINRLNEDIYVSYKLLYLSHKTIFLNIPVYCYFQRNDSISALHPDNPIRTLYPRYNMYLFFKENNEIELASLSLKYFYWDMLNLYKNYLKVKVLPVGFISKNNFFECFVAASKDYYTFCSPSLHQKIFLIFVIHFRFAFTLYQKILSIK